MNVTGNEKLRNELNKIKKQRFYLLIISNFEFLINQQT